MAAVIPIKRSRNRLIDQTLDSEKKLEDQTGEARDTASEKPNELDNPKNRRIFTTVDRWWMQERDRQAENRYQQAIDSDYYDQGQWRQEEAQDLLDRGQAPLVYNESAATIDWIIGTENRTRVDFKVFPRADDDVEGADVKTKTLKYLNDVNKLVFHRSQAFSDCVKVGLGWMEHGARSDRSQEAVFGRHESWRNMWHDSYGSTLTDEDWRYVHRVRWVDLDIAHAMFPQRRYVIDEAGTSTGLFALDDENEDFWYIGKRFSSDQMDMGLAMWSGYMGGTNITDNRRERVKLIETRYRMPTRCWYCDTSQGHPLYGKRFDHKDETMRRTYQDGEIGVYDMIEMRVWFSVRTDKGLLWNGQSPYKHNSFGFVPWWCYRRGRDKMPYGIMRRIRDPQDDLNKRASKSLYLLSANKVTADSDAVEDHDEAREEVARPDMYIIKKRGTEFKVENNTELAQAHLELMDRDKDMIRRAGGANDENLGHQTNAQSGEAIKARQLGGTIVTAQIFSNHRLAIQTEGEIRLSLAEQFLTEERIIRVTGAQNRQPELVAINKPYLDPDGTVRYENDITASQADFVVDEQDFSQSVRQAMFESMLALIGKVAAINPEYALRLLRMALEFSDLPNKDEMAKEVKDMLGIVDPGDIEKMDPQQRAQFEQQQQDKQDQGRVLQALAHLKVTREAAEVSKLEAQGQEIQANAEKIRAEAAGLASGIDGQANAKTEQTIKEIERRAAEAIHAAREEIITLRAAAAGKTREVMSKAITDRHAATTDKEARIEEAKIMAEVKKDEQALAKRFETLIAGLEDKLTKMTAEFTLKIEKARSEASDRAKQSDQQRQVEKQAGAPVEKAVSALVEDAKAQRATIEKVAKAIEENAKRKPVAKTVTANIKGKKITMRIEPDGGKA